MPTGLEICVGRGAVALGTQECFPSTTIVLGRFRTTSYGVVARP